MTKAVATLLFLAVAFGVAAEQPRAVNRYGQFIRERDGKWEPDEYQRDIAPFNSRPDTIPGFLEPYKNSFKLLTSADRVAPKTTEFVYKTYPNGREVRLAVDRAEHQTGPLPFILWVHGGGWKIGSYNENRHISNFLASRGYVVVRANYTLSEQGTVEDAIQDLRDAAAFVKARADEFEVDTSRFGVMGASAGGHLSSLVAMTTPGVKTLVSFCGPHDLLPYFRFSGERAMEIRGWFHYFGIEEFGDMSGAERYSPINNIPSGDRIPAVMLIHGTYDVSVPYEQSVRFAERLQERGAHNVELISLEYTPHFCVSPNIAAHEDYMLRIAAFLEQHLVR